MKIAVLSDNEETISSHFGRAKVCVVFETDAQKIVHKEMRAMPAHEGHGHGHNHDHDHHHHEGGHGRFQKKLAVMQDCQVVLTRGMGLPAYDKLQQAGLRPITTDILDMETAVKSVLDGTIIDNPKRRHNH